MPAAELTLLQEAGAGHKVSRGNSATSYEREQSMAVDGVDDVVVAPARAPSVGADQRIGGFLGEPSLSDLFQASDVLGPVRGINLSEFVEAVHGITGEDKDELGALFVRIDGKDDGSLSWDEILSYLHQQQLCRLEPKHDEYESTQYTCLDRKPPPAMGMHKEPVYTLAYVERCCSYVTASHDGSMRVWHADTLQLALTRRLSDRAEVSVNAMHQLPQSFAKLAVATADRMVTFFELSDLPTVSRWSVHGRIYTEEIPISLASFTVGPGDVLQCFAIGDVKGKVHIYDAVRLMERLWTELDRAHQVSNGFRRPHLPRPMSQRGVRAHGRATAGGTRTSPATLPTVARPPYPPRRRVSSTGEAVCGAAAACGADNQVLPAHYPLSA